MALRTELFQNSLVITGLGASGPFPELEEKLSLFGQFVGDWDILEDRFFQNDGSELVLEGELHWGWILGGKALQDVWMYRDKDTRELIPAGTTVRFYDSKIDAWRSVWMTPEGHVVTAFIGNKVEDEIVLEGRNDDGVMLKWIFYNIKPDSFMWRGEESKDSGKTWILAEKMIIRRKVP